MRIAITGADGQLGRALQDVLDREHELIALGHAELDLGQPDCVEQLIATGAEFVIHPAAYTDVDGCARDPERAYRVNGLGAQYVALACRRLEASLAYISTNEVFDGTAKIPYFEYDPAAPINAYARSKWAGERAVRELLSRCYIVRVAWLFGGERNFVRTVLRLAAKQDSIAMVEDEVGSPTYAPDVAAALAQLIRLPFYGTYHLVNEGICSRFAFAAEILRLAGREDVSLKPIKLADFKRDSIVPPYTPLHNVAAAALGIRLRPWQDALAEYIKNNVIDIIIPNYNGAALLPICLDALRRQTRRDFCVVVVNDGSTDDTRALLARSYPETQVIALRNNRGLAVAVNAAFHATGGEYVVLLNNDTEAHPRWVEHLAGALDRFPSYAFAASKLLLFDRRDHIHSAGDYYRTDGVPGNRGVWQRDNGQYDVIEEVFGPCAAAAAYRRSALEALVEDGRLLDEDLVMYCEDVDLNLRARLRGFRTLYVPQAVVYHRLSTTGGGMLASYYCGRNFILVWAKNMPGALARRYLPALLRAQLGFAIHSLGHIRESAARARLQGQLAGLQALPHFIRKRTHGFSAAATLQLAAVLTS